MKAKKLFQSEEEPQSQCRSLFSSGSVKNKSIFLGYWHHITTVLFAFLLSANASWAQAGDIDQIRNGSGTGPDATPDFVNGNAGASNAHYAEGWSIGYRMKMTGFAPGTTTGHVLIIEWDTYKGGKHALDYITSYQNLDNPAGSHQNSFGHAPETINPLSGETGYANPLTYPIPAPAAPTATFFNSFNGAPKVLTIYNGLITNFQYLVQDAPDGDRLVTRAAITFTANSTKVLIAWGGHIAAEYDWGAGNGATGISGSPYHTRLISLNGSGGNQDRSLQAAAVVIPPTCSVQPSTAAVCEGATATFTASGIGGSGGAPYTFAWTGPGGFTATTAAITVGVAGTYTVIVRDKNGVAANVPCTATLTVTDVPDISSDPKTACEGSNVNLTTGTVADGSTVTYHTTQADANSGANPIATPTSYGASLPTGVTTIYMRGVSTANTTCVGFNSFTVTITDVPDISSPNKIACETGTTNAATVDLTTGTVADGSTVTYHLTQADATNGANAIANPASFSATTGVTTIYLRGVSTANTTCVGFNSLTVTVTDVPDISSPNKTACETGTTGAATVNLTTGTVADGSTVTYHLTQADASSGANAIANPASFSASTGVTTIYLRGVSTANTTCVGFNSFTVTITDVPDISSPNKIACETGTTNAAIVDLTTGTVADGSTVTYHTTQADATNGANAIANPASFSASTGVTTIYLRGVSTANTTCVGFNSLTVTVTDVPDISSPNKTACETGTTGAATVNLTTGTVADGSTVTYHLTQADATNGANAIANPASFSASTGVTTIYLRGVSTANTTCIGFNSFTITITDVPDISSDPKTACEGSNVNLTTGTVADGSTVTYHTTQAEANSGANPIATPTSYGASLPTGVTTIYMRGVSTANTTCVGFNSFTVTITDVPDISSDPKTACEIGTTNAATVNLTTGTVADGSTVTYHLTQADANTGANPIANLTSFSASVGVTTIYLRGVSIANTTCVGFNSFTVTIYALPEPVCPLDSLFNLVTCGVTAAVAQTQANTDFATWFAGGPVSTPGFTVVPSFVYSSGAAPSPVGTAPIIPIVGTTPLANPTSVTVTWTITNTQTQCVNSCSATFRITYTCTPSCNHLATPVLCKGASTGSITVNVDAGTPPYAVYLYKLTDLVTPYSSQTGLIPISPSTSIAVLFANLPAGSYNYTVTDVAAGQCNNNEPVVVSEPATALDLAALGHTDLTCVGPNTGTITATFSGGTAPYQLKLDGGAAFTATSPYTFLNVSEGSHTVIAYDANYTASPLAGCTDQESVTVNPIVCYGHIFPTQTTCCNYVTQSASELLNVCAKDSQSAQSPIGPDVDVAVPGVFFYYGKVTAPSANFTIELRQTKGGNLNKFFKISGYPGNSGQIRLTTENCNSVSFTPSFIDSGAGARYVVTGATIGARYVVSVKYDSKSIETGLFAASPYVNTHNFQSFVGPTVATLVADGASLGHVDAVSGCSDNTPLPGACSLTAKSDSTTVSVGFDVYPVPFKDQLTIRYNFDYKTEVKIVLFDMLGRVLMTHDDNEAYFGKEVTLHPEFTKDGESMYFIRVITNRGDETKKIISGK